ncbi:class I SAM-dependent methyltransferase [Limibaculum sp. FT325]|uniref:class I SAM-dependent methyltransferase n=1 Tax=Thermohalobaculum sediminis TaxID=2939436 RepID=UPI0020BE9544|nr:class I SAM-dependent methyltransferase [Limibaculum sediminis]MCL5778827.1 class I SAM-dependent methyltransferase [Limibaculum sediminis]
MAETIDPRTGQGGYAYSSAALNLSHAYLLPAVRRLLARSGARERRIFEVGCGNGSVANALSAEGWSVTGIDPSAEGIAHARAAYPHLRLEPGSAYDPLASIYGTFPIVLSLEVVEHVYAPRDYARAVADLLEPGGHAILSTPYHGYLKNLALALSGRMDAHFTALWDHGHIKFWSVRTLSALLAEAGLEVVEVLRVGRVPPLAKSMVLMARKHAGAPGGRA